MVSFKRKIPFLIIFLIFLISKVLWFFVYIFFPQLILGLTKRMITSLVKVGGKLWLRGAGQTANAASRRASSSIPAE
jgi:hypothetical protein